MDAELFDGAGAESIAGGDEEGKLILEKEEGEFGEIGGFPDAINADNGDDVGTGSGRGEIEGGWGSDRGNRAEDVERRCGG